MNYVRMPSALRATLLHQHDATPAQILIAKLAMAFPGPERAQTQRELQLEPMDHGAPKTGHEGRDAFPYHAEVQGLGFCPDAMLLTPGDGRDVTTAVMAHQSRL